MAEIINNVPGLLIKQEETGDFQILETTNPGDSSCVIFDFNCVNDDAKCYIADFVCKD